MEDLWTESSDVQIIDACLGGNEKAWQVLVLRYKRLVYSIPIKWGLSPQDSVDIFQAVWLDCFRQLASLKNIQGLQPWLIRVAIRKCHRFSQSSRARGEDSLNEESPENMIDESTPASLVAEVDRDQMLRTAVERLPPRC